MKREAIAQIAHEVIRAMSSAGKKVPPWSEVGEATRAKYMAAVDGAIAANPTLAPPPPVKATQFMPIRYIGRREQYEDGAYGTHIRFTRGQSQMVPADKAKQMLKHPDVYEPGEVPAGWSVPAGTVKARPKNSLEERTDLERDTIALMNQDACVSYAKAHYGHDFDAAAMPVEQMRSKIVQLIDQFGIE